MANNPNPAIVEVTRGNRVESTHEVDIVVADTGGSVVRSWGDAKREIFPRSAIKSLQALPLVESGAADAFGFKDEHLALACSSHNGEATHVEAAREMLALSGVSEICLECGAQNPHLADDFADLVRSGTAPSAIHNNCSGKHSGFLAFAKYADIPFAGYIHFDHPIQREIAATLESVIGTPHGPDNFGVDGCSIPTFTTRLDRLAVAYAKFGTGEDHNSTRSKAMIRLRDACMTHPHLVAGKKRLCTKLMQALEGRTFVKLGAEGVYTACLPEKGLGIALKARDGTLRAAEVAVCNVISEFLKLGEKEAMNAADLLSPPLVNRNDVITGKIKISL